ncbi:ATP-binding cassette domain-containing protein [Microbacterium sp. CFH 31415]|uniref:ATP-binding cassette domain-containing protein n=1 Tax=Microbacterium sp. CFH 31415 TaxID=2921732 RepID=UPI001F1317E2|nr:ATP-binding cassette domain-containing protein [Microbacterium sp. CFH 31415]MCH6230851.1 ATP-binding cassette domain-containing protein [Microbacterium sp. CFH 31415]
MTALQVEDVVVEYKVAGRPTVRAVDGVSIHVEAGEVLGLVGESGCGKSSLGRAIVGLNPLDSGKVLVDGRSIAPLGRRARPVADRTVQMVFQDPYSSLNPRRRVGRQIQDSVPGRGGAARVRELLESVGLPASSAARFPHQFSGGQRQRIAIARALASEPRVIVADEPVSALDASTRLQVAGLLSDTATAQGVALLMISHDLSGLRVIADRIAVMHFGRIVEVAPTDVIWAEPRHPYTRELIGAIPRLGRDAPMPSVPERRGAVVRTDEEARLVECAPGHFVAAEALVAS